MKKGSLFIREFQGGNPSAVFQYQSPIGQTEIWEFFATTFSQVLVTQEIPKDTSYGIITYLESLEGNKLGTTKRLLLLGSLWHIYAVRYQDKDGVTRARTYYEEGLERSPNRIQFVQALENLKTLPQ